MYQDANQILQRNNKVTLPKLTEPLSKLITYPV
jgi:hypothetical protein